MILNNNSFTSTQFKEFDSQIRNDISFSSIKREDDDDQIHLFNFTKDPLDQAKEKEKEKEKDKEKEKEKEK